MRTRLPDRRDNRTIKITWDQYGGSKRSVLITVGFDADGRPKEVFCADFKAGSDVLAIVSDCCVLVSRLMQHGDSADELCRSMCEPPSLIGVILEAVHEEELKAEMVKSDNSIDRVVVDPLDKPRSWWEVAAIGIVVAAGTVIVTGVLVFTVLEVIHRAIL